MQACTPSYVIIYGYTNTHFLRSDILHSGKRISHLKS